MTKITSFILTPCLGVVLLLNTCNPAFAGDQRVNTATMAARTYVAPVPSKQDSSVQMPKELWEGLGGNNQKLPPGYTTNNFPFAPKQVKDLQQKRQDRQR